MQRKAEGMNTTVPVLPEGKQPPEKAVPEILEYPTSVKDGSREVKDQNVGAVFRHDLGPQVREVGSFTLTVSYAEVRAHLSSRPVETTLSDLATYRNIILSVVMFPTTFKRDQSTSALWASFVQEET